MGFVYLQSKPGQYRPVNLPANLSICQWSESKLSDYDYRCYCRNRNILRDRLFSSVSESEMTQIKFFRCAILFLTIAVLLSFQTTGRCYPGFPESSEFGFGGTIYPEGPYLEQGLDVTGNLRLDWIAVDFPIAKYYPEISSTPDWSRLDLVIQFASQHQIGILLSITQPPEWMITPSGPDPSLVSQIINQIILRYGNMLNAFELFPSPNTTDGWGNLPDPRAYANLFSTIDLLLKQYNSNVTLVTGGLTPLSPGASLTNQDDLSFLQGLYDTGIAGIMQIVGIDLSNVTGDPLVSPDGTEHRILRHYEEIRRVMLDNNHANGKIWITHLKGPSGTIKSSDAIYLDPESQAAWMDQAYTQMRSQLYIGISIYQGINPRNQDSIQLKDAIIIDEMNFHPVYYRFRTLIANNSQGSLALKRGKPKTIVLAKTIP